MQSYVTAARADVHGESAAWDFPGLLRCVPDTEFRLAQLHFDRRRPASADLDLFKFAQVLGRLACTFWESKIELHNFSTVAVARVLHLGRDSHCVALRMNLEVTVLELGVGEAETKLKQWINVLGVKMTVSDEHAFVVLDHHAARNIRRIVGFLLGNGIRQSTRRVDIAVQYVSKRVARFLTWEACKHERFDVRVVYPWHIDRAHRMDNHDRVLVGVGYSFDL